MRSPVRIWLAAPESPETAMVSGLFLFTSIRVPSAFGDYLGIEPNRQRIFHTAGGTKKYGRLGAITLFCAVQ